MKKTLKVLAVLTAAAALAAGYIEYENNFTGVTEYRLSPENSEGLDGLKICHLSDIHVKTGGKSYSRLIRKTAELAPDIILISGDLIDSRVSDISAAATLCETLCDIAPVYYVTGNHEERLPADQYVKAVKAIEESGVHVLKDRAESFEYRGKEINIIGVFDRDYPDFELIKSLVKPGVMNVLISHRPQFASEYSESGIDIAFCGHAHGGQVRIPFAGGLIAPDQFFFPEYYQGANKIGDCITVISRGIGNSIIPARINNRSEIVAVRIVVSC